MHEELIIDKSASSIQIYEQLLPQIDALINPDEPVISNLSNVTAALKQAFSKISWVGFYIVKGTKLYLGPFQGNIACTVIEIGKGVCGSSAERQETIIVENVDKFPGHIACDSGSKSEIVIPLVIDKQVVGVLDLDSYEYVSFDETDKKYLEQICSMICTKLELRNFEIR